jgi:hypothetical protein
LSRFFSYSLNRMIVNSALRQAAGAVSDRRLDALVGVNNV